MKIQVTGGAGFIGSCFVRLALQDNSTEIVNIDKPTYAGNLENLASVADNPIRATGFRRPISASWIGFARSPRKPSRTR